MLQRAQHVALGLGANRGEGLCRENPGMGRAIGMGKASARSASPVEDVRSSSDQPMSLSFGGGICDGGENEVDSLAGIGLGGGGLAGEDVGEVTVVHGCRLSFV